MDTALLENNFIATVVATVITLGGFSIKFLRGAFDFHYEYFTRRHLRRMTDLLPQVEPNSLQHGFLKQVINAEVFKIASGLSATNRNAAALMHLCRYKRISPNQVKQLARHLDVKPSGHVAIKIDAFDTFTAYYSLGAAIVIFFFGVYAFITSFAINSEFGWIAGAIMFLICCFVVKLFLKDFYNYRGVQRVRNELHVSPIPICEDCQSIINTQPAGITSPTPTGTAPIKNPGNAGASITGSTVQMPQTHAAHPVAADPSSA